MAASRTAATAVVAAVVVQSLLGRNGWGACTGVSGEAAGPTSPAAVVAAADDQKVQERLGPGAVFKEHLLMMKKWAPRCSRPSYWAGNASQVELT